MEFRLLGPVEVYTAGGLIHPGPPMQRCVLAALAVDAGRPVMGETLVDRVWGERPPPRVRETLYVHVARIRKLVESASASAGRPVRLVRRSRGYVLDVAPERVDLHRFRHLVEQAREPATAPAKRLALLGEALELWRGEPLADLRGDWVAGVRAGWRQEHVEAAAAWARGQVDAGNASAVIGPLGELVDRYPLAETLAAIQIRALHAAGRAADALNCYAATRRRLREQVGAEPGPELQALHRALLDGDLDQPPAPAAPIEPAAPTAPAAAPPPAAGPAQLPLDVRGFTGRGAELARLDAILAAAAEQPTAMAIAALSGTAGVGKTALAMHWAHRVRDRFPDGQLYVNLRGFDPGGAVLSPEEALRGFLDALGLPPERIPVGLAERAALYRSRLADRRMLVVLDNARDAEQLRPLLPAASGCLVLVTSRNDLSGLVATEGAHPLRLDLLTPREAGDLLARRIGADRTAAEPEAVADIVAACARLPLALAVAAARAETQPGFRLAALAVGLRTARGGLDGFAGPDELTDARAVFSWSYRTLSPAAARLFRLLGLHPGPDVSAGAAASLAGITPAAARPLLAELTRANLLTEHRPGRFTAHDLLRAYAREQAQTSDSDADRHAARRRLLQHYLHTAHAADRLLDPHRDPIDIGPPAPAVTPDGLTDHESALTWFTAEHQVLLAAVEQAGAAGFGTETWQLAWSLVNFLYYRGRWPDWADTQRIGLAAARRAADRVGQAHAHRDLGRAYGVLGRYRDAQDHLEAALKLFAELDDLVSQARIHNHLAYVSERQGEHRVAAGHSERAVALFDAAGHRGGKGRALNAIGWYHAQLGDYDRAIAACSDALALLEEVGDRYGQAGTWDSLGYAHFHRGDHDRAIACYRRTIDLYQGLVERYYQADTLNRLGDTYRAAGDAAAAREAWSQALHILDELDHADAKPLRAKLAEPDRG